MKKIVFALTVSSLILAEKPVSNCITAIQNITPMTVVKNNPQWDEAHLVQYEEAFKSCLSEYVQIETINPPGNENLAAAFFKQIFDGLQISNKEWISEGRTNFIATIPPISGVAKGTDPSMILYHHTDVVPVFPEQWKNAKDTFSGSIHDGFLWGRGSLDMKSTGIMQMLSMVLVKTNQLQIHKAIHFIAAADEEVGAAGAIGTLKEMKTGGVLEELMGADLLLNEGGYGVNRNGKDIFLIGVEEKGGSWMKVSHSNPVQLLSHLDNTFALTEENSKRVSKIENCSLSSAETHGMQVNVLPSKVSLSLTCPNGNKEKISKAFNHELAKKMKAAIEIKEENNKYSISIVLHSSAHGALEGTSALSIAAMGLQSIGVMPLRSKSFKEPSFYKYIQTPAIRSLIQTMTKIYHVPSWIVAGLTYNHKMEQLALKKMAAAIFSERLFRTSCSWTGFTLKEGKAEALVDCRLLHTGMYANPEALQAEGFVSEIKERAQDKDLLIEIVKGWQYAKSTAQSRHFEIMQEEIQKENPKAFITSFLTPTGSDNAWFRAPISAGVPQQKAIPSYGVLPTILKDGLTGTIHGSDERFPLDQIRSSVKMYSNMVRRMAEVVANPK